MKYKCTKLKAHDRSRKLEENNDRLDYKLLVQFYEAYNDLRRTFPGEECWQLKVNGYSKILMACCSACHLEK